MDFCQVEHRCAESRHPLRRACAAFLASLALVACGGGGGAPQLATVDAVNALSRAPRTPPSGGFRQLIVFGDSLSDDGAYTSLAVAVYSQGGASYGFSTLPYAWGGQFSVNGVAGATNWTDQLAQSLNLPLTPNIIGNGYVNPARVVYLLNDGSGGTTTVQSEATCAFGQATPGGVASCTNFAQGGARVTNPAGPGHEPDPLLGAYALTWPVSQQLANFLQQSPGGFGPAQLVTVLAGANDILMGAAHVQQVKNDLPDSWTPQQVEAALQPAVQQAQADVGLAADQLAGLVRQMLSHGASYLLVYTVPDIGLTPLGQSWRAGSGCNLRDATRDCFLLSDLVQLFNQRLSADLLGMPVKMVDDFAMFNRIVAQPAAYGLTNVVQPWCDPGTESAPMISKHSLFCNAVTPNLDDGASDADLGTWLFADDMHPTPRGQQLMRDSSRAALQGFGWI